MRNMEKQVGVDTRRRYEGVFTYEPITEADEAQRRVIKALCRRARRMARRRKVKD